MTTPDAESDIASAAPSPLARIVAVAAIVLASACGGIIGYAYTQLECDDDCTVLAGFVGVGTAIACALGVAVVVTLGLRAMGEWKTLQQQDAAAKAAKRAAKSRRRSKSTP